MTTQSRVPRRQLHRRNSCATTSRLWQGSRVALDVFEAGGFATQRAQIIQLGAADFRRAHQLDPIDYLRVLGKNALDALTEADLADRKTGLGTARTRDDYAFERLQTLLVAFLNLYVDANGIARNEFRKVGAFGLGQQLFDDQVRHNLVLYS